MGKKHYPIKGHHIKRLMTHLEGAGFWRVSKTCPKLYATNYTGKNNRGWIKTSAKEVRPLGLEHHILLLTFLMSYPPGLLPIDLDIFGSPAGD
jgi:hypothetical protein